MQTTLELVEVKALPSLQNPDSPIQIQAHENPFTLLFKGPSDEPLSQGLYQFEKPEFETCEIFITRVGQDPTGLFYEAVFN